MVAFRSAKATDMVVFRSAKATEKSRSMLFDQSK